MSGLSFREYMNQEISFRIPKIRLPKNFSPSSFFTVVDVGYTTYQIIPDYTVTNKNNSYITRALHELYKPFSDRLTFDTNKFQIQYRVQDKFYFDILLDDKHIAFYLTIPEDKATLVLPTINNVWDKCAIKKIDCTELYDFDLSKTSGGILKTLRHNFFSLDVDNRENTPLSHLLENQKLLGESDKVRINICGQPRSKADWMVTAQEAEMQLKRGQMPSKAILNRRFILTKTLKLIDALFFEVHDFLSMFLKSDKEMEREQYIETEIEIHRRQSQYIDPEVSVFHANYGISESTKKKKNQGVFNTNIAVLVQSDTEDQRDLMMRSILNNYNTISNNNEFIVSRANPAKLLNNIKQRKMITTSISPTILSTDEVSKLIMLPTKTMQEEFANLLKSISTREINVPSHLLRGKIPLGLTEYKTKQTMVYWDTNPEYFSRPKVFQGEMGSGKTTYGKNFVRETQVAGYWNLVIDVNDGSLVDDVVNTLPESFPEHKKIVLDFTNPEFIFRLGFNECLRLAQMGDSSKQADRAFSNIANTLSQFLNAITAEPLSDRMMRYFVSSIRVCLANGYCGVGAFERCLTDHEFRQELCDNARGKIRDRVIDDMENLNKYDKHGNLEGTDLQVVRFITDRLSKLIQTDILEDCFMEEPNSEINFRKWFDEGCFVGIKANKDAVGGEEACNVLITFLVQKAWSAILSRYDDIKNQKDFRLGFITMDEPHSFPLVCKILTGAIRESRKWRCGFNFMVHDLDDLGAMLPKLVDAGASFVLFRTSEKNYKRVENIMKPFTIEEALQTKEYHAIHIVDCKGERAVFDALTLDEPTKRYLVIDNVNDVIEKCWDKYGN